MPTSPRRSEAAEDATAAAVEQDAPWPASDTFTAGGPAISEPAPGTIDMNQASAAHIRARTVRGAPVRGRPVTRRRSISSQGASGFVRGTRSRCSEGAVGAAGRRPGGVPGWLRVPGAGASGVRSGDRAARLAGCRGGDGAPAGAGSAAAWASAGRGPSGASTSPSWWPTRSSSIRASCGPPGPSPRTATRSASSPGRTPRCPPRKSSRRMSG